MIFNVFCFLQNCSYCKQGGASIGCWIRVCRKSFHLHCAIANNCATEFTEDYRSYCNVHFCSNTVNTITKHTETESCAICILPMGEWTQYNSIKTICCNDNWIHKKCAKGLAFTMADDFCCPNCQDNDDFRFNMLLSGVYIPDENYSPKQVTINPVPEIKRRRMHKEWIHEKEFKNVDEARSAIQSEKCWSYHYLNNSSAGVRINYRCNLMKFRGTQCAAGVYLLFDSSDASIVHLYRADAEHTHADENNNENAVQRISGEMETEIRSLFANKIKPKSILYQLVEKGFNPPTKSKLTNFLTKLRKEKFGSERLHFGTLKKWLIDSSAVPTDEHEPFIVAHTVHVDEEDTENCTFKFFVSTQLLLKHAVGVVTIHTDATYKLVWQGFPILLVGTTDSDRKFHPFGICVCTNEQSNDFEFMFQSLKAAVNDLFEFEIDPKTLVCDAGHSIHIGWKRVFPLHSEDIAMCWAHARRAVAKNISKYLKDTKSQVEFLCEYFLKVN